MSDLFSKVTAVYFSATGTNETSVCAIAEEICEEYSKVDLTKTGSEKEEKLFNKDELIVIGAPVYGGRIYKGAMERFTCLKGNETPCIVTATYGNRDYDDALMELSDALKKQGFIPFAAAALIGQHTFGEIQVGRPDALDISEDKEFAKKAVKKFESCKKEDLDKFIIPGNRPYKDGGNGGKFRPVTTDACDSCGTCVSKCPENAIAKDCKTLDADKCISCFACIRSCPKNAKVMDSKEYDDFAKSFSERLSVKRDNVYFL